MEKKVYYMLPENERLVGADFKEPITATFGDGCIPTPYVGIKVAARFEDGSFESYFKCDDGLSFEETKAHKLIHTEGTILSVSAARIKPRTGQEGAECDAVVYTLPMYDPTHRMFAKTVLTPAEMAINTTRKLTVELVLAFDEGMVYPTYWDFNATTQTTTGIFEYILDTLNQEEFLPRMAKLDKSVRHTTESEDGYAGYAIFCSAPDGRMKEVCICDDMVRDLRQNVVSLRLVDLQIDIH